MKNNRFENNRFDNYNDNYTRGRAVAPKKQSRTPLALAIISLVLVSLLLASTVWLVCMQINHRDKAQPAAITATISQNNALPKSATPAAKSAEVKQTATQPAAKTDEVKQSATQPAVQKNGDSPAMAVAKKAYAGHSLAYTDAANIILVDGERVYMDTKRIAPEHTGTPLHIYANGKTSYGFD
jgi:cytoskeletal protein RodZ